MDWLSLKGNGDYLHFTTKLWYLETDGFPYLEHEEKGNKECAYPAYVQIHNYRSTYMTWYKGVGFSEAQEVFPTFSDIWRKEDEKSMNKEKKKGKTDKLHILYWDTAISFIRQISYR
eukprot:11847284-Ditylum_brightwellii.AAC.1